MLRRLAALGATVALLLGICVPAASAQPPPIEAYGSCAGAKPFKRADHCTFDRPEHARGTIVFRSHIGKRSLRVCQQILGLSFKGRQCLTQKSPTAYEAIPFHLGGAYDNFKLVVTVYTKRPGSNDPYKKATRVTLRFAP